MTPSSPKPPQPDPLQHVLNDAEAELRRRLREACVAEAKGVSTESTQEIRHLEDTLLAAAVAAQQTITVRRHMKNRPPEEKEPPITTNEVVPGERKTGSEVGKTTQDSRVDPNAAQSDTHVREFTDDAGLAWRAWPVTPGLSRASAAGRRFLGDFQDGWICFEGLDRAARRRLPRRQAGWGNITEEELQQLLAQAIDAPERETKRKGKI